MKDAPGWYEIADIDIIDSPALVLYEERIKHNIALAIAMAGSPSRLRPHIKTHKTKEVVQLMMNAGITKFKCATIAEAELLGSCGAPDVLLAYQPVGPKLQRYLTLIKTFPDTNFSCLIDNEKSAGAISDSANAQGLQLLVFIDLNVGMNRTGVSHMEAALLHESCLALPSLEIAGIHAYDGHINDTDPETRNLRADEAFAKTIALREQIKQTGRKEPVIVVGGSPTFPIHSKREAVECSPGTFVYWDKSYADSFPDMDFQPAALVISRVVSVLEGGLVCVDLGHKSIAAENPLHRRVFFLNCPEARFISQSEEHLVISLPEHQRLRIGDILYGMPFHVCPTCALYDSTTVIRGGKVQEQWKTTARDRRISI